MTVWSLLPHDLLVQILGRLSVVDFARFCAVCHSWLLAASTEFDHGPTKPQSPMLMLHGMTQDDDKFGTLVSIPDGVAYRLRFPQLYGRRCVGTSLDGWLITEDSNSDNDELHIVNPFTGADIPLPTFKYKYLKRALVFSVPFPIVIVLSTNFDGVFFAKPGDECWRQFCIGHRYTNCSVQDVAYHRERFYALCAGGLAIAFLNPSSSQDSMVLIFPEFDGGIIRWPGGFYLAETADGDQLLQVWKYEESFKVFRADRSVRSWVETDTLGERSALFLGGNRSAVLSTRDLPELKEDCIYFAGGSSTEGVGIFDMKEGSYKCLPYFSGSWFMPHYFRKQTELVEFK